MADTTQQYLINAGNPQIPGDIRKGSWYFGVCPRDTNNNVIGATTIWSDLDHTTEIPNELFILPPSAMVSSGHGLHFYHNLDRLISPVDAIRLTKLAVAAFDGDIQICEPTKFMRLPGSINAKYLGAEVECEIVTNPEWYCYKAEDLEERLVAAIIAPIWGNNQRHALALALAALLARAQWPIERVTNVIDHLCAFTNDYEKRDRYNATQSTFRKIESGLTVSSGLIRDLLSSLPLSNKSLNRYTLLITGLGITSRDGDLIYKEEVFGKTDYLEKALVDLGIRELGDWGIAEGVLTKWTGTHWEHYNSKILLKDIFDLCREIKEIKNGEELEFNPSIRTASNIQSIMEGHFWTYPIGLPVMNVIPVENGVIELPDCNIRDHKKSDNNRYCFPVIYDLKAECPTWIKFLREATDDEENYNFLQEWFGYTLRLGNPHGLMVWIQGVSGTGKSTCVNMNYSLFGKGAVPISANALNEQTIAAMANAYVSVCAEISRRQLQTRKINEIVTGDVVQGRFLYGKQFDVRYTGKIMWSSNSFPPVDEGEGFWRRLVTISFNKQPKNIDPFLRQKLDAEISGIFNWALEGLKRIIELESKGLTWKVPDTSVTLLQDYQESAELIKQFQFEYLDMQLDNPNACVAIDEVYSRYKTWCESYGHRPMPCDTNFFNEMKRLGLKKLPKPHRFGKIEKRAFQGAFIKEIIITTLTGNDVNL